MFERALRLHMIWRIYIYACDGLRSVKTKRTDAAKRIAYLESKMEDMEKRARKKNPRLVGLWRDPALDWLHPAYVAGLAGARRHQVVHFEESAPHPGKTKTGSEESCNHLFPTISRPWVCFQHIKTTLAHSRWSQNLLCSRVISGNYETIKHRAHSMQWKK